VAERPHWLSDRKKVLTQLSMRNPRDFMFARYLSSNCTVTYKLGTGITQGHRKWHHSIARLWFPIPLL